MYELCRATKSHRLVSLQLLSALNLFFGGGIQNSRDEITELYQSLTFEILSGRKLLQLEKISDLSLHINIKLQESIIPNLYDKDKTAAKNNEKIEEKYNFLKQKNTHKKAEEKIASDILNNVLYKHKKTDESAANQKNVIFIQNYLVL